MTLWCLRSTGHYQNGAQAGMPLRGAGQKGGPSVARSVVVAGVLLIVLAAGTACTASKPKAVNSLTTSSSPTSTSPSATKASPTTSPTPTIDPQAQPAATAYMNFMAAAAKAQENPPAIGVGYAPDADITKYSFDPLQHQYNLYISDLQAQGVAFKGTPPIPRVTVSAINLAAEPYPTVILADCPTPAPSWKAYDSTGKVVADKPGTVPPPHKTVVQMINYGGHWGVYKSTPDASKTCSA